MRYTEDNPIIVAEVNSLMAGPHPPIVCSINLGEVHYTLARREGFLTADDVWDRVCRIAEVKPPSLEITRAAARIVTTHRIPLADAHAAATALAYNAVLWAGDEHLNKPGPWKRRDLRKLGISPRQNRKNR